MKSSRAIQTVTMLVLVVSIAFIAHQRNELQELRSELATRRNAQTSEVLAPTAAQRDDNEQIAELARLRNQFTQLKRVTTVASNEMTRLRSELARLGAQLSTTGSEQSAIPRGQSSIEPGKGIGDVRLGMTYEELARELGSPSSVFGPDSDGVSALAYPGHGFSVVCSNAAVIGMQLSEAFAGRTKEGIGIGSTGSEVVTAFGNPTEAYSHADGSRDYVYPERGFKLTIGLSEKVRYMTLKSTR